MDEVEFAAPLELLAWGRSTYTVLYLDDLLEELVVASGARRIMGSIEGVAVNLGVNRAGVTRRPFCYIGATLQRELAAPPGEVVTCRLRPAHPEHVPLAEDVRSALEEARQLGAFQRRRPAQRRQDLRHIDAATLATTRRSRIEALVLKLAPVDRGTAGGMERPHL